MERIDPRMDRLAGSKRVIWTIGHSTRSFEEFVALLAEHRIALLVDVRHYPTSKRVPWATKATLPDSLTTRGVAYEHFADLGGFRKPLSHSENKGWRNTGFRGYADYMASPEFVAARDLLMRRADQARTAIMCAEAVPWKCHRSLLSDSLQIQGFEVEHILAPGKTEEHRLTKFARVDGTRITYPEFPEGVKPLEDSVDRSG